MKTIPVSLHIGAHKTASTHLQKTLEAAADQLADWDVCFLGPKSLRKDGVPLNKRLARGQSAPDMAGDCDELVISEENLMGPQFRPKSRRPLYPQGAKKIADITDALTGADVTLYMAVRDPATWLASLYAHAVFNGLACDGIDAFTEGRSPDTLRWSDLIAELAQTNRVVVWSQEDYQIVFPQIVEHMLGEGAVLDPIEGHVNSSISAAAIAVLEGQGPDRPEPQKSARIAKAQYPVRDPSDRFQPWPRKVLEASRAAYLADLNRIMELENVTLLRRPAS
ncbi:hypothetical protein HJ526_03370 [Donghicola sp. C2-DW-16]|uniref:Sulfotransferase family protein n=1 Tax=Donghicola mangrovi TaxID=2729614 RepID=A0ABX2PCQ6_9RHOB|nr:hypothetical protein [Donghicola mangrovi]NVO26449.1 hypothetical protein [Donghicola mangrovi]